MEKITAYSNVFIRLPSSHLRLLRLSPNSTVNLGKFGSFHAKHLIGRPYGQSYEILPNHEIRLSQPGQVPWEVLDEEMRNNRTILDDPANQQLTIEEIEAMKKDTSLRGSDIVAQVIDSHRTFDQKSLFSQQKYAKRKLDKFHRGFTTLRPDMVSMVDFLHEKDAQRILNLSVDSLSHLLALANVHSGGRYLVMDDTNGLVVAALLDRMGGEGEILLLHEGEHAHYAHASILNIEQDILDSVVKPLNVLQALRPDEIPVPEHYTEEQLSNFHAAKAETCRKRWQRHCEMKDKVDRFQRGEFDSLILATSLDPVSLFPDLLPKISPSGCLVAYSQYREELLPAHVYLNKLRPKKVLALDIHETRLREYQTLPGRMHPLMTGKGWTGHLLFGIVIDPIDVEPIGTPSRRRKRSTSVESDDEAGAKRLKSPTQTDHTDGQRLLETQCEKEQHL